MYKINKNYRGSSIQFFRKKGILTLNDNLSQKELAKLFAEGHPAVEYEEKPKKPKTNKKEYKEYTQKDSVITQTKQDEEMPYKPKSEDCNDCP